MYATTYEDAGYELSITSVRREQEPTAPTVTEDISMRPYEEILDENIEQPQAMSPCEEMSERVPHSYQRKTESRPCDRRKWISPIALFVNFAILSACLAMLMQMGTKFSQLEKNVFKIRSNAIVQEFSNFSGPSIYNHSEFFHKGQKGESGSMGAKGVHGDVGLIGHPGLKGFNGKKGASGPRGYKGAKGSKGSPGINGTDGQKGEPGTQGPKGSAGGLFGR